MSSSLFDFDFIERDLNLDFSFTIILASDQDFNSFTNRLSTNLQKQEFNVVGGKSIYIRFSDISTGRNDTFDRSHNV